MPNYEVHHSFPLEPAQKKQFAEAVTKLHATTFTTPSFFVHVRFISHDATDQTYFVGGEPAVSTNRILAMVRTSDKRSKKDFDDLGEKIEEAWLDMIKGERLEEGKNKGQRKGEVDETDRDREAKKLLAISFYPMVTARELSMVIPAGGEDVQWLKDNMDHFRKQGDENSIREFQLLLDEIDTREDLQKLGLETGREKKDKDKDKKDDKKEEKKDDTKEEKKEEAK